MSFDVAAFRAQFPALDSGIAHFDGPGGTQTPRAVGEAIARTLSGPLSNRASGWSRAWQAGWEWHRLSSCAA